ncbi:MAG: hypothetical protein H7Z74_04220 [Anaerolineae bacterium]|nr:hypothetical protein [Gemmatimonadaceae bacterium]
MPVPIIPLYGHEALRARLASAHARGALPPSLLLHGPRGVGKQRLALWIGQMLLCDSDGDRPCGACRHCRYVLDLAHPDLRWFFPRPRLPNPDPRTQDVLDDFVDAIGERRKSNGLYSAPGGSEALYVATVRAILQLASLTPAMGRRKIFVIGDAERMVSQEGSDQPANAFLKMLEEPQADTQIILTSSEPGSLLPTIRSRAIAVRVPPLVEPASRSFLGDPVVNAALDRLDLPASLEQRIELMEGAPGMLLESADRAQAIAAAREFLDAVSQGRAEWSRAVAKMSAARARGFFADVLDAMTVQLHARLRGAAGRSDASRVTAIAHSIEHIEDAKVRVDGNVNPQLLGASIAREVATWSLS